MTAPTYPTTSAQQRATVEQHIAATPPWTGGPDWVFWAIQDRTELLALVVSQDAVIAAKDREIAIWAMRFSIELAEGGTVAELIALEDEHARLTASPASTSPEGAHS